MKILLEFYEKFSYFPNANILAVPNDDNDSRSSNGHGTDAVRKLLFNHVLLQIINTYGGYRTLTWPIGSIWEMSCGRLFCQQSTCSSSVSYSAAVMVVVTGDLVVVVVKFICYGTCASHETQAGEEKRAIN